MADLGAELAEQVTAAAAAGQPLEIIGGGSKAFYGHPVDGAPLEVGAHSGVVSYEPTELVLSVRCGTPLDEIEKLLESSGQMLSFEPPRFAAGSTIGGTVATGLGGPRRPWGGAPRDLLLGTRVLDGRGDILRFGGEVMKNVAGYDLSRLMAGALGTLGVLLEVSLKVLPRPESEVTLALELERDAAVARMRELAVSSAPLSAACHHAGRLMVRLSGNAVSVTSWLQRIGGEAQESGQGFWQELRDQQLDFFRPDQPLWRLSLPPATPRLECEEAVLTDWGGAQRWVHSSRSAGEVRAEVAKFGGHAILFRHDQPQPARFHPLDTVRARFGRGLRQQMDPHGILNPGRLGPT